MVREGASMVLNFGQTSNMFPQSQEDNLGIGAKGKESYLSLPATVFIEDTNSLDHSGDTGTVIVTGDVKYLSCAISLPNGAVITECIVYGNAAATAETWELVRTLATAPASITIASANVGTADKSILSVSAVENDLYYYNIITTSLDTNDTLYGIKITYTI